MTNINKKMGCFFQPQQSSGREKFQFHEYDCQKANILLQVPIDRINTKKEFLAFNHRGNQEETFQFGVKK